MGEEQRLVGEDAWRNAWPGLRERFEGGAGGNDKGVGAVEVAESGGLEVGDRGVEDGEREVGLEEAQDAVRFEDGVFGVGEELADAGHGLGELTLAGADPEGSGCADLARDQMD